MIKCLFFGQFFILGSVSVYFLVTNALLIKEKVGIKNKLIKRQKLTVKI